MRGVFEVLLEKTVSLLDRELSLKLFERKDEFLDAILDFYHQLKLLDGLVDTLILHIESLLQDFGYSEINYFYKGRHRLV